MDIKARHTKRAKASERRATLKVWMLGIGCAVLFGGCASPSVRPGVGSFGTRAGYTLNRELGLVAGFGARNIQDLKIIPFSFMGLTGCLFEIDNRPLISGSGAPLILGGMVK
jgi:hypothetical protein